MNNINAFYHSKYTSTLSSLLNDAATTINETYNNSQYKLQRIKNINNNVNTCSCMLHLVLLQVIYKCSNEIIIYSFISLFLKIFKASMSTG